MFQDGRFAAHHNEAGSRFWTMVITRLCDEQLAVDAGADSDKYPPSWLFHQKWSAGRGKGPAPTLDGHQIEVAKVAGRVSPGRGALEVICYA